MGETLSDVIGLGCHAPDPETVHAAAQAACADAFIRRLPQGYGTSPDAAPMSGGERQRIGLARAFAQGQCLLILDDATSSLDTVTERQVTAAMTRELYDRTRLIVAHRVATAASADRVVWLEGGRVRAFGRHQVLWKNPDYRAVFQMDPSMRDQVRALLWRALQRKPYQLARLVGWSIAEVLPAFVIGHAIARAVDDGFAAARPGIGLGWLAVLGGAWLLAVVGARQVILAIATIVVPVRDQLLTYVVDGTLHRSATLGQRPDTAAVARLNLQVELARDAFAAVIMVVRAFAFTVVSVVLGMMTLIPEVLLLVLPPFAVGLGLFLCSLPSLARRQRAFILADERTVESVTAMVVGLRDIAACGAEDRIGDTVDRQVTEQANTGHALARVTAARTVSLAVGGWLPILLVVAGAPWLLRSGASAGIILGALAYVMQSLTPALGSLVQGLGTSAVRLMVTLDVLDPRAGSGLPAGRSSREAVTERGAAGAAPGDIRLRAARRTGDRRSRSGR